MGKRTTPRKGIKLQGLPRTAAAARKLEREVEIHLDKLSRAERKKWIQIAPPKLRNNVNAMGVIRPPDGRPIPKKIITRKYVVTGTIDPNVYIVCYYSASGVPDDCYLVSLAQLRAMKPSGK